MDPLTRQRLNLIQAGYFVSILGILLTATGVGAICGLPLVVFGGIMMVLAPSLEHKKPPS